MAREEKNRIFLKEININIPTCQEKTISGSVKTKNGQQNISKTQYFIKTESTENLEFLCDENCKIYILYTCMKRIKLLIAGHIITGHMITGLLRTSIFQQTSGQNYSYVESSSCW